jgi:leucyl aminopeptidase
MTDGIAEIATPALPLHAVAPAGLAVLLEALPPAQAAYLRASGFAARAQELRLLPGEDGIAGAVLGLGADAEDAASPWAFGAAPFSLPEGTTWRIEGAPDPVAATLGWMLGAYRFTALKSKPGRAPARLVPPPGSEAALAEAAAKDSPHPHDGAEATHRRAAERQRRDCSRLTDRTLLIKKKFMKYYDFY